jgi:hypothetical protein
MTDTYTALTKVETPRNAMFYGARMSVLPEAEKTYDNRAAARLDSQACDVMRKAQ